MTLRMFCQLNCAQVSLKLGLGSRYQTKTKGRGGGVVVDLSGTIRYKNLLSTHTRLFDFGSGRFLWLSPCGVPAVLAYG